MNSFLLTLQRNPVVILKSVSCSSVINCVLLFQEDEKTKKKHKHKKKEKDETTAEEDKEKKKRKSRNKKVEVDELEDFLGGGSIKRDDGGYEEL